MKTFLLAAAAVSLLAGAAQAQDKPAGAMSSSSSMSSSAKPAMATDKPMSKKDMKAMDACHKMTPDAMAKSAKCQKLMAKPTDAAMPMKK